MRRCTGRAVKWEKGKVEEMDWSAYSQLCDDTLLKVPGKKVLAGRERVLAEMEKLTKASEVFGGEEEVATRVEHMQTLADVACLCAHQAHAVMCMKKHGLDAELCREKLLKIKEDIRRVSLVATWMLAV